MKRTRIVLPLLLLMVLLAACGEEPTATRAPATTAAAATTSRAPATLAATTTSPVAVATTRPVTTIAIATTQTAATLTIPAGNTFTGNLEVYRRVLEAMSKPKSYKFRVDSGDTRFEGVLVKPDRISGALETGGQKAFVVLIGKDFYLSLDAKSWQKTSNAPGIGDITGRLTDVIPPNLTGSTFALQSDEKLDGKDVGVFSLDTSTAQSVNDLGKVKLTFKYDKQTFQVLQALISGSGSSAGDIRYSDFDNPAHKIEPPI